MEGGDLESTLKAFQFGIMNGYSEIPEGVWCLLSDMTNNPQKPIPYVYDIVKAGMEGRIDIHAPFYLDAYCRAIESNTKIAEFSKAKKVLHCVDEVSGTDKSDCMIGYGDISLSKVSLVARMEDAFEKLADDDELMYALSQVKGMNDKFIVEHSVDLVTTLKYAVKGIPAAVTKLRAVCNEFSDIAEYVRVILSSGRDLNELFA